MTRLTHALRSRASSLMRFLTGTAGMERKPLPTRRRTLLTVEMLEDRIVPAALRNLPGFTTTPLARGDDLTTPAITLPFGVNFLGQQFSQLFVNTNGNVTFDGPLPRPFTPDLLAGSGHSIIAPYFADVDTTGIGTITYGTDTVNGHLAFGVDWINVGYFNAETNKTNTFQLIIIDRSDVGPGNFDVEFNYDNITWETGDFSGGVNGLGGISARAGYSNGSGVPGTFFELPGSGINGAFLNSNATTGLINSDLNSPVLGRYDFTFRNGQAAAGQVTIPPIFAVGAGAGSDPIVNVYDAASGSLLYSFNVFGNFRGGVRVAVGDVTGDGVPDVICAAGPGGGPQVTIVDGASRQVISSFFGMASTFTGGLFVAVGDLDRDGRAEIVLGADRGGGPQVNVCNVNGTVLRSFYAFTPSFTGGVRVAVGDFGNPRGADILTGAGPGGGPQVTLFDGRTLVALYSFYGLNPNFRGGVYVAAGDLTGDGIADFIVGAGEGGLPQVSIYDGLQRGLLSSFYAFPPQVPKVDSASMSGGVRVGYSGGLLGRPLLFTGSGTNAVPAVNEYSGLNLIINGPNASLLQAFFPFDARVTGGVYVGG